MKLWSGFALLVLSVNAHALGLGRLSVQSALGEPLRAEIEVTQITPEEASSLNVRVAGPEAFRAAGMDFNPILAGLRATLQRRPDGRPFLQLAAPRPVQDPFLDLILEVDWSGGRLVRDFTMLFDPPSLRGAAARGAPASAAAAPAAAPLPPVASPPPPAPTRAERREQAARAKSDAAVGKAASTPAAPTTATPAREAATGDSYTVKAGDTLGKIADRYRGSAASLDQMLVALFRSNPDAFVGNNVNRLKAGVVLKVPTAEETAQLSNKEARQTLAAQSRDFAEYRRTLAGLAPGAAPDGQTARAATGKLDVKVDESKKATASADKLKLEKGSAAGAKAADMVASDRAKSEAAARAAELNRNVADLNKAAATAAGAGAANAAKGAASAPAGGVPVGAVAAPPAAKASSAAVAAPPPAAAASVPTKVTATAAATPAATKASVPAASAATAGAAASAPTAVAPVLAASAPASTASAPAAAAPVVAAASAPVTPPAAAPAASAASAPQVAKAPVNVAAEPPPPEPSLLDELMDNPMVPAGAAGVVALLAGFGVYRLRQRRNSGSAAGVDSSFLESRLQPDSFFGASGGQRIDTKEGALSGSSMVYSPSQLEAAGDVDPVAEADVYLAYGRDLQAEEILKEAIKTQPDRVSVRVKLLEIYAKRRDARGFETLAADTYRLTGSDSPDWERVRAMGSELEPSNSLYSASSTGVPPERPGAAAAAASAAERGNSLLSPSTLPNPFDSTRPVSAEAVAPPSIDLDLDFSMPGDAPAAPAPSADSMAATQPISLSVPEVPSSAPAADISFDLDLGSTPAPSPAPVSSAASEPTVKMSLAADAPLDFGGDLSLDLPPVAAAPTPAPPAPADDGNALSFDLSDISLDLPSAATQSAGAVAGDDESDTKLALAEEFRQIGDVEAARQLLGEVLGTATGETKAKAQRLLADLS